MHINTSNYRPTALTSTDITTASHTLKFFKQVKSSKLVKLCRVISSSFSLKLNSLNLFYYFQQKQILSTKVLASILLKNKNWIVFSWLQFILHCILFYNLFYNENFHLFNVKSFLTEIYYPFQQIQIDNFI